jgi:hypothetical protein
MQLKGLTMAGDLAMSRLNSPLVPWVRKLAVRRIRWSRQCIK